MAEGGLDELLVAFRGLNPLPAGSLAHLAYGERARAALADILAGRRRRPRFTRRRSYLAGLILVAGASTAAAVTTGEQPSSPQYLRCFATPSLGSPRSIVVTPSAAGAAASCRALFASGAFGRPSHPAGLQVCVLPGGALGVFPSDDPGFCTDERLANAAPLSAQGERIVSLERELASRRDRSSCLGPTSAARLARRALRSSDLSGWTVRAARGFDATSPCAISSIVVTRRLVLLVPVGRAPTAP